MAEAARAQNRGETCRAESLLGFLGPQPLAVWRPALRGSGVFTLAVCVVAGRWGREGSWGPYPAVCGWADLEPAGGNQRF